MEGWQRRREGWALPRSELTSQWMAKNTYIVSAHMSMALTKKHGRGMVKTGCVTD